MVYYDMIEKMIILKGDGMKILEVMPIKLKSDICQGKSIIILVDNKILQNKII